MNGLFYVFLFAGASNFNGIFWASGCNAPLAMALSFNYLYSGDSEGASLAMGIALRRGPERFQSK